MLPARRPDMSIEADLIEEIARLYGYDNLPVTYQANNTRQSGPKHKGKFVLVGKFWKV